MNGTPGWNLAGPRQILARRTTTCHRKRCCRCAWSHARLLQTVLLWHWASCVWGIPSFEWAHPGPVGQDSLHLKIPTISYGKKMRKLKKNTKKCANLRKIARTAENCGNYGKIADINFPEPLPPKIQFNFQINTFQFLPSAIVLNDSWSSLRSVGLLERLVWIGATVQGMVPLNSSSISTRSVRISAVVSQMHFTFNMWQFSATFANMLHSNTCMVNMQKVRTNMVFQNIFYFQTW